MRGGGAPVRVYLPELLDDVLAERINPGRVLDYETDPDGIGEIQGVAQVLLDSSMSMVRRARRAVAS